MKIFITGGTGFFGSYLVKNLIPHCEKIYFLCRRPLKSLLSQYEGRENIIFVKGDITSPDIVEDSSASEIIKSEVDIIFHGAGYYDLEGSYSDCFLNNVVGTQNMIYFSEQCTRLKDFHYLSTVAIAGDHKGEFFEKDFDLGQKFSNHYSKTKFEAEAIVREARALSNTHIYRLGILIGDSQTGKISKTDGPYYFLKILSNLRKQKKLLDGLGRLSAFLPLPYNKRSIMPLIPVDEAEKVVREGILRGEEASGCYHVLCDSPPSLKTFVEDSLKFFGFNLGTLALPKFSFYKYLFPKVGLPFESLEYSYSECIYDKTFFEESFSQIQLKSYDDFREVFYKSALEMFR